MDDERAQPWQLLTETEVYNGYTRVRRDTYRLPDGSVSDWDVLDQGDTVAVIAFTDTGDALLFEQYRVGPRALVRELPGGLIDTGEDALTAGARELLEETGHRAAALFHAGSEWSGANSTRRKNVVVAAGCRRVADPHWEDGETGVVRTIGIDELVAHLLAGGLSDAGEAARGLLVFTRASVADPVLRRAQERVRSALERALRSTPALIPSMSSHCSGIASIRRTPRRRTQSLGASSTRVDRRMPAPHSSGRRCMTRSARKKPRSRCTGRLLIGAWPPRTARRRSSSWRAHCATWATPPPRWRSCARSATTTR